MSDSEMSPASKTSDVHRLVMRAGFVREWEGDVSDYGNMLYASDESEKDDNPNWVPVYALTPDQIDYLVAGGFTICDA